MPRTLILGYGNPDRQDDGVAWHILAQIAGRLGYPVPQSYEDEFENPPEVSEAGPALMFVLQLTPEMAEMVAQYDRVCFIDAHTGNIPHDLQVIPLEGEFQTSPFTHHMTPATCLALAESLYGRRPEAILASVRGYEFGFSHHLSPRTQALAEAVAGRIVAWLSSDSD